MVHFAARPSDWKRENASSMSPIDACFAADGRANIRYMSSHQSKAYVLATVSRTNRGSLRRLFPAESVWCSECGRHGTAHLSMVTPPDLARKGI